MQIRSARVTGIGSRIGLNAKNSYLIPIFLGILIVSLIIGGYYIIFRPQPEPYNSIFLLDNQKLAVDYPQVLIANKNSTLDVYVNVENHMGGVQKQNYQVQIKIANNISTFPVSAEPTTTYNFSLSDGNTWSQLVPITLNDVGGHWIVFELYRYDHDFLTFTYNYCVLNIQVLS
jgi:uncharacterized membrane protein